MIGKINKIVKNKVETKVEILVNDNFSGTTG